MDCLNCDRRARCALSVDTKQLRSCKNQDGPKPLAAANRRVTHRTIEIGARIVRNRKQIVKSTVYLRRNLSDC
jgi:hypothetical protein